MAEKFLVHGTYSIDFDIEIEADSPEDAKDIVVSELPIEKIVRKSFRLNPHCDVGLLDIIPAD